MSSDHIKQHSHDRPVYGSVVQDWLSYVNFMQQTVVLTAIRGVDGVPKDDPTKDILKALRKDVLKNADPSTTYMNKPRPDPEQLTFFFARIDHYNIHWFSHFLQAAEVIGYKCPDVEKANYWLRVYIMGCQALHHNPETEGQMDARLPK